MLKILDDSPDPRGLKVKAMRIEDAQPGEKSPVEVGETFWMRGADTALAEIGVVR